MLAQRKGVENLNGAGEGSMKHGGQDAQQLPLERARASVRAAFLVSGGPDRNARPPVNRRRASSARSRSRKRRPTVPRTGPPPFSSLPAHNGPSNGIGGDNGRDELGSTAPDESDVAVSSGVENSMRPQSLSFDADGHGVPGTKSDRVHRTTHLRQRENARRRMTEEPSFPFFSPTDTRIRFMPFNKTPRLAKFSFIQKSFD